MNLLWLRPLRTRFLSVGNNASVHLPRHMSDDGNDAKLELKKWMDVDSYKWFLPIQTRWKDNDQYGHVNNSVYQSYFDSAANVFLWRHCGLRTAAPEKSDSDHPVAFIVECKNQFFQPIMYPNVYMAGLSVGHLGNSSIRYRMAIFKFLDEKQRLPLDAMEGYFASEAQQKGLLSKLNAEAVALGTFVHVTVDPRKQTPTKIPAKWRESLSVVLTS